MPRVKRILRWITRLLPTLHQAVPQHPLDHPARHLRQLQELRQRERPALRLQQFPHAFFSPLPLRALRLRVIFFFVFFLRRFLPSPPAAFPPVHSLRPSHSSLPAPP